MTGGSIGQCVALCWIEVDGADVLAGDDDSHVLLMTLAPLCCCLQGAPLSA